MDETYVINQVKEDACYVSDNFRSDMLTTTYKDKRNTIIREYILPDFSTIKRGYMRNPRTDEEKAVTSESVKKNSTTNKTPEQALADHEKSVIEQQTIVLNNERIAIPEILFHPSDIGIAQMGIAEAVVECVKSCPEDMMFSLLGNIAVTGGNALFPSFQKRLYAEIRSKFDENMVVNLSNR